MAHVASACMAIADIGIYNVYVSSSSYTASTALGIKLEVEQVWANVFHSTFFYNFFLERVFTSLHNSVQSLIRSPSAIQSVYRHVNW